jgi:hypothetical protein
VTNNTETVWTKTGYSNLKHLGRALEKHNKSKDHIVSACKFVLFGKQNIATVIDTARKMEIEKFKINVRENREIIKSLIDIAIFLCKQELSFRRHDEGKGSSNRGNFKELVSLFSKRDVNLKKIVEEDTDSKSVFCGTSKTIQSELIDSINYVLNTKIDNEILASTFISWQVDETTDISCTRKSQLSVIFRYVNSGKILERFRGFFDVSTGRTAEHLFQLLISKFNKYDLKNKLIAQTYDGAAIMASELNGLHAKIKSFALRQFLRTAMYMH